MDKIQLLNFSAQFVIILGNLIIYAVIARVLLSWFSMGSQAGRGRFSQFVYDLTDPVMNLAKKVPFHRIGMIDLSPLIVLIGVDLLTRLFIYLIQNLY